jgi:hypothetical protein
LYKKSRVILQMLSDILLQLNRKFEECITNRLQFLLIKVSKSVEFASFSLHLTFGGTLDRRYHFKHFHSNTAGSTTAKRARFTGKGSRSRQCGYTKHKIFPYRPTRDIPLLSGHGVYFIYKNEVNNISTVNPLCHFGICLFIYLRILNFHDSADNIPSCILVAYDALWIRV